MMLGLPKALARRSSQSAKSWVALPKRFYARNFTMAPGDVATQGTWLDKWHLIRDDPRLKRPLWNPKPARLSSVRAAWAPWQNEDKDRIFHVV